MSPTTSIPSALPTITGSVVFVELTKQVTESLSSEDLSALVASAEEAFGLNPGNVEAVVTYDVHGVLDVELTGDYEESQLVASLQQALAESLNVHVSDVSVVLDPETGVISYTISSESAEDGAELQAQLQSSSVSSSLESFVMDEVAAVTGVRVLCFVVDHGCLRLLCNQKLACTRTSSLSWTQRTLTILILPLLCLLTRRQVRTGMCKPKVFFKSFCICFETCSLRLFLQPHPQQPHLLPQQHWFQLHRRLLLVWL